MTKAVHSNTLSCHLAQEKEVRRTRKGTGISATPNLLWQIHLARPWFEDPPKIGGARHKPYFLLMEGRI